MFAGERSKRRAGVERATEEASDNRRLDGLLARVEIAVILQRAKAVDGDEVGRAAPVVLDFKPTLDARRLELERIELTAGGRGVRERERPKDELEVEIRE